MRTSSSERHCGCWVVAHKIIRGRNLGFTDTDTFFGLAAQQENAQLNRSSLGCLGKLWDRAFGRVCWQVPLHYIRHAEAQRSRHKKKGQGTLMGKTVYRLIDRPAIWIDHLQKELIFCSFFSDLSALDSPRSILEQEGFLLSRWLFSSEIGGNRVGWCKKATRGWKNCRLGIVTSFFCIASRVGLYLGAFLKRWWQVSWVPPCRLASRVYDESFASQMRAMIVCRPGKDWCSA